MKPRIVLDPHGDNSTEAGFLAVRDEVDFLRHVVDEGGLFVQGESLCDWAAEVAKARGWLVSWRTSPGAELRSVCPALTTEQASALAVKLGGLHTFQRPLSVVDLAVSRWPELDPSGKTEAEQAWSWLLWRAQAELGPEEEVLIACLGDAYETDDYPLLRNVYVAGNPDQAWELMKEWSACQHSALPWPPLPTDELTEWAKQRLMAEWRLRAIETHGEFFRHLVEGGAQRLILRASALVAFVYYRQNPHDITLEALRLTKPYLPFQEWQILQALLPAKDPGPHPTDASAVSKWFVDAYLPFRLRGSDTPAHLDRIRSLGREFGLWYLSVYSNARVGGAGGQFLSWSRTAELAKRPGGVNLLIVLDGLGYVDAQELIGFLSAETSRLSLDDLDVLFAPLPTVTCFAKPALMAGVTPVQALEEKEIGPLEKRDPAVVTALNGANDGEVVIWSVLEPDTTYHKPLDVQTLRYEVAGHLRSLAQRISHVIQEVNESQKLRVFITTDHGRLLSKSQRVHAAPPSMKPHGRAAWGSSSVPFDKNGLYIEGALAYIDADRFGISNSAAVVLSDEAFLTSDGKTGSECFAHGGVFPEEVLIPWIELTRDRGPLSLATRLSGRGVAGASGHLELVVTNPTDVRIQVVQLRLSCPNTRIDMALMVGPLKQARFEQALTNWPQRKELATIEATTVFVLPTGERQSQRVVPDFTVEEMYSRDTMLDDLL